MWKRKQLKDKAKKVVKNNYWTAIIVCFLIALITGEFGTSIVGMWHANDSMDPNYIVNHEKIIQDIKALKIPEDLFSKENITKTFNDTQIKILEAIEANLNSALKSQK